jgi:hypothetical protein
MIPITRALIAWMIFWGQPGEKQNAEWQQYWQTYDQKLPKIYRVVNNNAFQAGESLQYKVKFGFITAGSASFQIPEIINHKNRPSYRIVVKMETNGTFSTVFKVRDWVTTYVDVNGLFPWYFERRIHEGSYRRHDRIDFDHYHKKAFTRKDTLDIDPYTQDTISIIYYTRVLPLSVGDKIDITNYSPNKVYHLRLEIDRREKIKVPAGTFDCYHIKPGIQPGYDEEARGQMELWVTADERKIPVQVKTDLPFGSLTMKLKNYKGLAGHQLVSKP